MNCPICNHSDLPDTAIRCPSCGTDMTAFYLLEDIKEQRVADNQNLITVQSKIIYLENRNKKILAKLIKRAWIIFLLLAVCLWQYCGKRHFRKELTAEKILTDSLSKADSLHKAVIFKLEFQNADTTIVIQEDNNPSYFAEQYYGNPLLYPIIIQDNHISNDRRLMIGDTIILRKTMINRKLWKSN